jgi:hypothetical protein
MADELVRGFVEPASVTAPEDLDAARDAAQRLLQIVRGDVGELLELDVRSPEIVGRGLELALDVLPARDLLLERPVRGRETAVRRVELLVRFFELHGAP